MPQRATLSFSVSNPLGAADLLLHGEDNLKGWGQFAFADPTLLYVRGFDTTTDAQRYKYEVNHRFGSTNPQFNSFRAPVTLTMQVRVDVGPTRERQQLTQQLDRGRKRQGQKTPEFMLKAMYGSGGIINPLAQILRQADTLQLTGLQADSLASMNRAYTVAPRQHLDPGREISRRASGGIRSGRGLRALHRGAEGLGRSARPARADDPGRCSPRSSVERFRRSSRATSTRATWRESAAAPPAAPAAARSAAASSAAADHQSPSAAAAANVIIRTN